MVVTHSTLEAALNYASLGLPILPLCPPDHAQMPHTHRKSCKSPGKTPILSRWAERGVPATDEIETWYTRNARLNVGLLLGQAGEESGWNLVGIDIDGPEAEKALQEISKGVLPTTWEFVTGNGRRLLYLLPEGARSKKFTQKQKQGELAFLAQGQQTVMPPSLHVKGTIYQWAEGKSPDDVVIADAPQWLLNKVLQEEELEEEFAPSIEHADWTKTVEEGERSNHLTRLAGSLIARRNIPKEQVLVFLRAWNREHCKPPLEDSEIISMINALHESERVKSSTRKKKRGGKGGNESVLRPIPAAEAFLKYQKERGLSWKYSATRGMFYRCDDTLGPWMSLDLLFVQKIIRQYLLTVDESLDKQYVVNEVVSALREILADEGEQDLFDLGANPNFNIVQVANGMLEWQTGMLKPWDPGCYSTIRLPVAWNPGLAERNEEAAKGAQMWQDALEAWLPDQETRAFLQEFVGYCLIPDCSFRTAVFLFGGGANGKSLFLEAIAKLFGDHISYIPLHRIAERFEGVGLVDKLVNLCGDIDPKYIKETSVIKSMISGEAVRAEYKYGKSFHFLPTARLIFSANALPKSLDKSHGWYSRWRFVEFPNQFNVNPMYKKELLSTIEKPEVLSHLLEWAVEGLRRLFEQGGFTESLSMRMSRLLYQQENDSVMAFAVTSLVPATRAEKVKPISLPTLYQIYEQWCREQGVKTVSQIEFTRRLKNYGYQKAVRPIGGRSTNCLLDVYLDESIEQEYNMMESIRKTSHSHRG